MADKFQCGLVLLAAGGSTRMGRPKQLLPVRGRPLIRFMAEAVLAAPVSPVVIVLGAHARKIEPALAGLKLRRAVNPAWAVGMASSLKVGVEAALDEAPKLSALIIALADQPALPPRHLEQLIARFHQGGRSIVASRTGAEAVPPVLFGAAWFPALCALEGDTGARAIVQRNPADVALVPLASNADLDTPADYDRFTRGERE